MGDGHGPWEDRFRILGRLGEGGMGVVYEAIEASTRTPIALKVMRTADPKLLQRFKREFRALADIHHPNLVALYELFASADRWAFTMELVRGSSLSELLRASIPTSSELATESVDQTPPTLGLRPDGRVVPVSAHPPQLPAPQLLAIARQLASGVAHLHATGHVHCDIKPSNVLVGDDGRVALCDFGLIDAHRDAGSRARAIGTVAYMSPEQARRASLTDASDWYAFGAVLYAMLTGRPPFVGEDAAVLAAKQRETPTPVASLNPRAPADLASLCEALLVPDRRQRPRGADVLAWLGAQPAAPGFAAHVEFVGRHEERARLGDALAAGGGAETAITLVHGASGIGKSTLVRRAIEEASRGELTPLVLAGRCYQQESVPYKAFDPIIDELVDQRLRARDPAIVAAFEETDTAPLARMFPVLRRLTGEREAPDTDPTIAPHEARELGITALRALFTALARQRSTIVWIDDAQWMDPASARLLRGLLRVPGSPPIALVLSHRGLASATWREAIVEIRARDGGVRDEIAVEPLPFDDAVEMAARALGGDRARAAWVAREAAGNPFFIAELAQANLGGSGDVGISDVIARRVSALGAAARATLDTIVVAGRPLPPAIVARSAGVAELAAALHELRALRLVQTRGDRAAPTLEAYHDRIRAAVAALLDDDARARLHRGLARAYATIAPGDDEALAVHWHGAGAPDRAAPHAERAAIAASGAFAFDRAAALFRLALAGDHDPDHRQHLRRQLAQALVDAGRAMEAAEEFLVAAAA
ncbi:MAG: protein kinase, partial [Deltaproteobacteria bacterium]|nr:protein kinase [Deltaproteobacteria bacterium]